MTKKLGYTSLGGARSFLGLGLADVKILLTVWEMTLGMSEGRSVCGQCFMALGEHENVLDNLHMTPDAHGTARHRFLSFFVFPPLASIEVILVFQSL